jgi:hypothetical protein
MMRRSADSPSPVLLRRRRARARHPEPEAATPSAAPERRERVAGRPEDEALYTCGCGCAFTAAVTASVACPHCGGAQSW